MQSIETASQAAAPAKVVDISDFGSWRQDQIEKWLIEQIYLLYGDKDENTIRNPLLRISTKFEALSSGAQYELYGFARGRILGMGKDVSLKDRLWSVLEKGARADGSWADVEEFADTLLIKEKTYKAGTGV